MAVDDYFSGLNARRDCFYEMRRSRSAHCATQQDEGSHLVRRRPPFPGVVPVNGQTSWRIKIASFSRKTVERSFFRKPGLPQRVDIRFGKIVPRAQPLDCQLGVQFASLFNGSFGVRLPVQTNIGPS